MALPLSVTVGNSAVAKNANTTVPPLAGGGQGEALMTQVHGWHYNAAYNGNVFSNTAVSSTIPVTGATLASKWAMINPANSGKVLELIRLDYHINSATEVAGVLYMAKVTTTAAGLGTLTAGTIRNVGEGGGSVMTSVATYYSAATHTDTPVVARHLVSVNATAVGKFYDSYEFHGTELIFPGYCIDLIALGGAQTNALATMVWAEWPLS